VIPLFRTLVALVESVDVAAGSGLRVESVSIDVPLEGRVVAGRGAPVFLAHLPHTRWRSGLLPPVHVAHLDIAEAPAEDEG
jgi:hypothetical protein